MTLKQCIISHPQSGAFYEKQVLCNRCENSYSLWPVHLLTLFFIYSSLINDMKYVLIKYSFQASSPWGLFACWFFPPLPDISHPNSSGEHFLFIFILHYPFQCQQRSVINNSKYLHLWIKYVLCII